MIGLALAILIIGIIFGFVIPWVGIIVLGGLTLEMYRRSTFRDELLIERCREIVALEERLNELDSMLSAVASAKRAPRACECGAPVPWGSHFCGNCGRPVGGEAVVACEHCGHPLPADAKFCAGCGP